MSSLFARLTARFRDGENVGYSACYGLFVSVATTLLFCVLAATASVWKAFVFGGLALAAFVVAGCLAPESWCMGRGGVGAEQEEATAAAEELRSACRSAGLAEAAIDAIPTFAYASGGGGGGDIESGGGDELCPVCLEDMEAGEMVRRLPACEHLFHVECIDMWLHSHRTCPICRRDLSPPAPRKVAAEAETTADYALPTVYIY